MYSYHLNQLCLLVCFLFVCSTLHYTDTLNPASILCTGWIPFYYWLKIKPSAKLQKEPLVIIGIIKPYFTFMLIPGPVTEISDNCSPVFLTFIHCARYLWWLKYKSVQIRSIVMETVSKYVLFLLRNLPYRM